MKKEKVLIVNPDLCTGCGTCEMICSMTWSKEGEFNPRTAFIKVLKNNDMNIHIPALKVGCVFCNKCVQNCLPGAIKFVDIKDAALITKGASLGSFPAPLLSNAEN